MRRFLQGLASPIEWLNEGAGIAGSLVLPFLMLVVVGNVVLRYGFGFGLVELEELQWHLNAITVMLCLGYAYRHDAHVRVDVLRERWSPRRRAWIEIAGVLLFLLPFTIGIAWFSWGSFTYSWSIGEGSPMPSGLPARYLVKLLMFVGIVLLLLQGIAALARNALILLEPRKADRS
ncbi:TRAP transporter small permease subunit [Tropicimonas sp. IMCC34011]|uniref:TRAP transporter small permease subunit n=1 Tax=Tropicimonas sp. IMCC34011 TaxID=2248759 RepID=UPI000E24B2BC|nr:TRAP transporter small permease subunit [Tropicimonas sp. IMCC34011]